MRIGTPLLALLLIAGLLPAQPSPNYDECFSDGALRLDFYFCGDARDETITLDRVVREGPWPGTRRQLIDPFSYGRYTLELHTVNGNQLVFRRGFDAMFGEYRTTAPALAGIKRVFSRSLRVPAPKQAVYVVVTARDRQYVPHPIFIQALDPADYHIAGEPKAAGDETLDIQVTGPAAERVDLVFLSEGYTAAERDKFWADARRFGERLFGVEPYRTARADFNVRAVFRPSPESGMDEPRQGRWRRTALGASFNAFDLDRYQLTEENHGVHEMAGQVPCDTVVLLTNSSRYGGGGIYNDYALTTVDNERSLKVFVHEFGHSFAGLADEYYSSEVAYNDFYPKGVEPLEPNITAHLDPENLKWKDLLSPGIARPTDWGKEQTEALQAELGRNMKAMRTELEKAAAARLPADKVRTIQKRYHRIGEAVGARLADLQKKYAGLEEKVGLFEGAGYQSKGLFRPQLHCLMFSNGRDEFCAVCRRAIRRMIDYYCGR